MGEDIAIWKSSNLSPDERLVIMRNLGFFATAESLVANNITLAIFRHITNAECRQYLLRQAFEEAIHTHTFHYIVESLGLDEHEVFGMYHAIPSIAAKDDMEMKLTSDILDPHFSTANPYDVQRFLRNMIGYYVIMEGIFFYAGFAMILSFHRQNKMKGIGEQFQYILRDESIHLAFGVDLINGIKAENPDVWTADFRATILDDIVTAVGLEIAYAHDCLPSGVMGLTAPQFDEYVKHIANRRMERIGLSRFFDVRTNPFPWMSEVMDLGKEKNFFESRVTEYNKKTLTWD
jgi:ribonucleoside-diphosphate reductase beta chain